MDASKITELRKKQATVYINRRQPAMESSTLTWQKKLLASTYIQTPTLVGSIWQYPPNAMGGGAMNQAAIGTAGVTPEAFRMAGQSSNSVLFQNPPPITPNPLWSARGSGSFVYSSDSISEFRAGQQVCATYNSVGDGNVNAPLQVTLPRCFCSNEDIYKQNGTDLIVPPGADISGNWLNPYLPIPQPYASSGCGICGLYKVNINGQVTPTYVHDPVVSTTQNGHVVYSSIAPNMVFIPNNDGTGRGTLVADGTTKPRATDPRVLP